MISFCDGKLCQCDYPFETDIEQIPSVGTESDYYNDEELDFVQPHKKIEVNLVKFDTPYADTISRQAAIDAMREETCMSCWDAKDILKHLPHASTEKIGRWINDSCSICNYGVQPWNNTPYCPNCGAKMQEVE